MFSPQMLLMTPQKLPVVIEAITAPVETSGGGGSVDITLNYNASGDDRLLLAVIAMQDNGSNVRTLTSVSYNSVTGTIIKTEGSQNNQGVYLALAYWVEADLPATSGNNTLNMAWDSGSDQQVATLYCLSNVDQTNPIIDDVSVNAQNVTAGADVTFPALVSSGGELAIGGVSSRGSDVHVASNGFVQPTGWTEDYDKRHASQDKFSYGSAHIAEVADDSEVYTWTIDVLASGTENNVAAVIASIQAK